MSAAEAASPVRPQLSNLFLIIVLLSSFDLVASVLKGFEWEMEGFLEETLKSYEEIGLTQDNLIKLTYLLQDNHKKEMAAIEAADAQFAIKNRERIKVTLKCLKDLLINSKLYYYYKDGNRSFIPLFFIAYHLFHKQIRDVELEKFFANFDAKNTEHPKMERWVYHSRAAGMKYDDIIHAVLAAAMARYSIPTEKNGQ